MNAGGQLSQADLRKAGIKEPQLLLKIPVSYPDDRTVLCVDYYTPPVGWIYDYFDNKWIHIGVHKRSPDKSECYWERDPRFGEYRKWKRLQDKEQVTNPDYKHPQLRVFERDCWRYRLSGYWYDNNGEDTYLPGNYWYLISVYNIDTGYPPDYNEAQRNLFMHWELMENDPDSFGLLVITQRRGLKTYSGSCIGVEKVSRTARFRMGVQSKTEDDGIKVYTEHVFFPFRELPYFFIPQNINLPRGDKAPAKGLKFNSGNFLDDIDDGESRALLSEIVCKNSKASAFDGYKVHYYYVDEDAKSDTDPYKRWTTAKKSLVDKDRKIVGKSLQTTTIEEITPESLTFMRKWADSNQFNKPGRQTKSGLHKHFIPAHMMQNADKYGKVNPSENIEKILEMRTWLRDDPHELAKEIRQNPLNEVEAFTLDSEECRYNPILLGDRITELTFTDPGIEVGNLVWKDGVRFSQVEFVPNPNGKFLIKERPNAANCVIENQGYFYPQNKQSYCAGSDTYDHRLLSVNTGKKFSLGSTIILKKPNPLSPTELDYAPVLFYLFRPEGPDIFYEDSLMAVWWYGCEHMIETNKPGMMHHYEDAKCAWFVPIGKNGTRGCPAGVTTNNYISDITEQYINRYTARVFFVALLEQWKRFKPEKTTEFDAAMAFGYAYMLLVESTTRMVAPLKTRDISEVVSIMRRKGFGTR